MGFIKKLLAVGVLIPPNYFIYRELKKKSNFKKNLFLQENQITELKNNKIQINTKSLALHPINNKLANSNSEKILIIGGGIVGITQAYILCQNTNANIILIEKNKDIGLYSSYANGAIFQLYQSWMNKDLIKDLIKSFFGESRVTMKLKGFLTPDIIEWGLNMLYNISDKKFQQNNDKLKEIIKVTQSEFDKILLNKVLSKQDVDSTAAGTVYVYKTPNALNLVKNKETIAWKRAQGFEVQTLKNKDEILAQEPYLVNTDKFMDSGILSKGIDKNINTYKLLTGLSQHCVKHFSSRYDQLCDIEFEKFIIRDIDKKVIGVVTNQGVILADKIIVCGGIYSQSIIKKLGLTFPLSPMRGYTVTVPVAQGTPQMRNMVVFSEDYFYQTQLSDQYRISMFNDIVGHDLTYDQNRAKKVIDNAEIMVGKKFFDRSQAKLWTGIRPVSPDDVPILGPFKKFPNVYVNAGHGSKGMGTSLGCAKLIQEQISNLKRSMNEKDYSYSRFFLL